MSSLPELSSQLAQFGRRCRAARWFGALFHVGVAQDIVADVQREERRIAADAFTAEQADLEAEKLIRKVICDGHVTPAELPLLRKAIRHIHASARHDHAICDHACN